MTTFLDELLAEVADKESQRKIELDRLKADQLLIAVAKLESQMHDANKLSRLSGIRAFNSRMRKSQSSL